MLKWPTLLSLEEELDYSLNRAVEDEGVLIYDKDRGYKPNPGGQAEFWNKLGGFSADNDSQPPFRVMALIGGIGSGKSFSGAVYLLDRILKFPEARALVMANSFAQLANATLPALYEACFRYNIPIEPVRQTPQESALAVINKHPSHLFLGPNRNYVYVMSATSFSGKTQTGRGLQAKFAWYDEASFGSETAFNTLDGRIGRGPGGTDLKGSICITTSPNGFNWLYYRVADPARSDEWKKTFWYVNCPTKENIENLGEEYVTSLMGNYVGELGQQELEGLFLNTNVGLVYKYFRRSEHTLSGEDAKLLAHNPGLDLVAAFDFNYSPAVCVLMQHKAGELHVFKEFFMLDSDVYELSEKVRDWIIKSKHSARVLLYGDASGRARSAVSKVSAWDIVKDTMKGTGCEIVPKFPRANCRVNSRIDAVNFAFRNQLIFIDLDNCPELVKDFEMMTWKGEELDKSSDEGLRSHLSDAFGYSVFGIMPYGGQQRPVAGTRPVAGFSV